MASAEDGEPPAAREEEPKAPDGEQEPIKGWGDTADNLADVNADDPGRKKLMNCVRQKNS